MRKQLWLITYRYALTGEHDPKDRLFVEDAYIACSNSVEAEAAATRICYDCGPDRHFIELKRKELVGNVYCTFTL